MVGPPQTVPRVDVNGFQALASCPLKMSFIYKKVKRKRAGTGVDLASQSVLLLAHLEITTLRNDWEKRESKLLSEFIEEYENNWIEAIIYAASVTLQDDQKSNSIPPSSSSTSASQDPATFSKIASKSVPDLVSNGKGYPSPMITAKSSNALARVKIPSAINLLFKSPSQVAMPESPRSRSTRSPNSSSHPPTSPRLNAAKSIDSKINGTSSSDSYKDSKDSLPNAPTKLSVITSIITNFSRKPLSPRAWESHTQAHASIDTPYPTAEFKLPWSPLPTSPTENSLRITTPETSITPLPQIVRDISDGSTESAAIKQEPRDSSLISPSQKEGTRSPAPPDSQESNPTSPTSPKVILQPRSPTIKSEIEEESRDEISLIQFLKTSQSSLENSGEIQ